MKNISISEKLILNFVLLGVVVIIIIGSYTYHFSKKALISRTFDQLISLRLEKKNRIEQFFIDRFNDAKVISQSSEINTIVAKINENNKNKSNLLLDSTNSYLGNYISSHGYYQAIYISNLSGNSLKICNAKRSFENINCHDTNKSDLFAFCESIKQSNSLKIKDLSKSQLLIYLGCPIKDSKNKIVGVVVLEIPLSAINKIMFGLSNNNGLGKSGETYLVGADFLMRSNSRFHENAVLKVEVKTNSVIKALKGEIGTDITTDYRSIRCLSSYSKLTIEGLNWLILAEIDEQEAMVPVYSIRNSILLLSILIAASVFGFAFLMAKRITQPIKRLQKASIEVGSGNYDLKLEVKSLDEIGALTETFNEMTARLKFQKQEIEEEKTKRFNALIDGQEMERQRLSRDLHDGLGQSILAVKIKLEQTKNASIEKTSLIVKETQELLKTTIQEIRHISNDLMPPVLDVFGIETGLKNLCQDTSTNSGIQVNFLCTNLPESIDKRIQIYIYRISQEAINNIIKHSGAKKATLAISKKNNCVILEINDDGIGFDFNINTSLGNGILNMKQRVELLNGICTINSLPLKGTQIIISIPV